MMQSKTINWLYLSVISGVISICSAYYIVSFLTTPPSCKATCDVYCVNLGQTITLDLPEHTDDYIEVEPQPMEKLGRTISGNAWCRRVSVLEGSKSAHGTEHGYWVRKDPITGREISRTPGSRSSYTPELKPRAHITMANDESLRGNTFTLTVYSKKYAGERKQLFNKSVTFIEESPSRQLYKTILYLIVMFFGLGVAPVLSWAYWEEFNRLVKIDKKKSL